MGVNYFKTEIDNKSLIEKLELIENIEAEGCFSEDDLKILDYLSQDKESEVRLKVAEVLVYSESLEAEKILTRLLKDKTVLVRVNACDSLCNSKSLEVLNLLKNRISKDRSSLVRGYAALSIADIVATIKYDIKGLNIFFNHSLENEKSSWLKIIYYKVLYMFGDEAYLYILINELKNKLYRNRLATINILDEICSEKNIVAIKAALIERLKYERTIAVKNSIENSLKNIDSIFSAIGNKIT